MNKVLAGLIEEYHFSLRRMLDEKIQQDAIASRALTCGVDPKVFKVVVKALFADKALVLHDILERQLNLLDQTEPVKRAATHATVESREALV